MFNFLKHIKIFSITFLVLLALLSFSNYAYASTADTPKQNDANVLQNVFCNVFLFVKSIGKPLLLLIIVFIAALAYFGKVQLVAIVMIVIGAAVFFGAPTIVGLITGDKDAICTSTDYANVISP